MSKIINSYMVVKSEIFLNFVFQIFRFRTDILMISDLCLYKVVKVQFVYR